MVYVVYLYRLVTLSDEGPVPKYGSPTINNAKSCSSNAFLSFTFVFLNWWSSYTLHSDVELHYSLLYEAWKKPIWILLSSYSKLLGLGSNESLWLHIFKCMSVYTKSSHNVQNHQVITVDNINLSAWMKRSLKLCFWATILCWLVCWMASTETFSWALSLRVPYWYESSRPIPWGWKTA